METLYNLGERELVSRLRKMLRRSPSVLTTFEEDAEIFEMKGNIAITTELNCQGTHFRGSSPVSIGKRVVVSTVSDLLAKGALPQYMLTSVSFPRGTSYKFVQTLYKVMDSKLKEYGAFLIGGDTVESDKLVIATTALGTIPGQPLVRKNAQAGDKVVLTGEIGNGALGYQLMSHGLKGPEKFFRAQLEPELDFKICKKLMKTANAGIDVSDGLAYQLAEVARQSKKKITIREDKLPIDLHVPEICKQHWFSLEDILFHIGDDYQVVYTIPNPPAGHVIGKVEKGEGLFIKRKNGKTEPLEGRGWEGFREET